MKQFIALAAAALLVLTGCGGADTVAAAPETPAPTQTATKTAEPACDPPSPAQAMLLARSWERVVASRGASDHADMADEFFEAAQQLSEDFKDGNCKGDPRMATAAELAYEASVVNASALVGSDRGYQRVPPVGNKLLDQMGVDGQFATP